MPTSAPRPTQKAALQAADSNLPSILGGSASLTLDGGVVNLPPFLGGGKVGVPSLVTGGTLTLPPILGGKEFVVPRFPPSRARS